jgi:hypothetical protein
LGLFLITKTALASRGAGRIQAMSPKVKKVMPLIFAPRVPAKLEGDLLGKLKEKTEASKGL